MDTSVILLGLVFSANLYLGLFVLLRNNRSHVGQSFFSLTLLINFYAVSNYLTDNATTLSANVLFNRLAYLSAFLALVAAAVFSRLFSGKKSIKANVKVDG